MLFFVLPPSYRTCGATLSLLEENQADQWNPLALIFSKRIKHIFGRNFLIWCELGKINFWLLGEIKILNLG